MRNANIPKLGGDGKYGTVELVLVLWRVLGLSTDTVDWEFQLRRFELGNSHEG
jgi:hypothetical protein